jgi:hypothetical protein
VRSCQNSSLSTIWPPTDPSPQQAFGLSSMDFITNLPVIGNYNSMFIMVDRFTKMTHFIPYAKTIFEAETANLFFKNIVQLHRLLNDITFNRELQFISHFWQRLLQPFGCIVNLS